MVEERGRVEGVGTGAAPDVLNFGTLRVDRRSYCVELLGVRLPLTRVEFDLFERLVLSGGNVVSYRELAESVLRGQFASESATLRVHVSHLRSKLGKARACLVTVRGRGLAFEPSVFAASSSPAVDLGHGQGTSP
jgi:two-component system, OmpR family, response regulator QseB